MKALAVAACVLGLFVWAILGAAVAAGDTGWDSASCDDKSPGVDSERNSPLHAIAANRLEAQAREIERLDFRIRELESFGPVAAFLEDDNG